MALYHFVTDLEFATPRNRVWDVLENPATWPRWWRWLRRVDVLEPGQPGGLGARYRFLFSTAMRYGFTFESETVRIARASGWESRVTGELEGTGRWEFADRDGGSRVRYTWIVAPTKRWMNLLTPVARPVFSWNHDVLMRALATGVAREAGTRLLSVESRTISPRAAGFGQLSGTAVS